MKNHENTLDYTVNQPMFVKNIVNNIVNAG